ncbi:MAG: hypothetical protein AB1305_01490 [Candidatus Hadarchaeota archaeon]
MRNTCSKGVSTSVVAVVVIIVIVAVASAYIMTSKGGGPGIGSGPTAENLPLTQLTFSNSDFDPDWSPDGSKLVYTRVTSTGYELWIINADGTGATKIGSGFDPSWSPNADKIAYTLNGEIYTSTSSGGSVTKLTTQGGDNPAWSPDGTKIAYARGGSIWVMNSDGSGTTNLTSVGDGYCSWPSYSYDGTKIVYIKGEAPGEPGTQQSSPNEIWTMGSDGSNKQKIYGAGDTYNLIFQRAWNNDNKILFMRMTIPQSPPDAWVMNSDGSGATVVLDSDRYTYGDPVWNNAGNNIALIKGEGLSQNVFTLPYP